MENDAKETMVKKSTAKKTVAKRIKKAAPQKAPKRAAKTWDVKGKELSAAAIDFIRDSPEKASELIDKLKAQADAKLKQFKTKVKQKPDHETSYKEANRLLKKMNKDATADQQQDIKLLSRHIRELYKHSCDSHSIINDIKSRFVNDD